MGRIRMERAAKTPFRMKGTGHHHQKIFQLKLFCFVLRFVSEGNGEARYHKGFLHRTPIQNKSITSLAAEHVAMWQQFVKQIWKTSLVGPSWDVKSSIRPHLLLCVSLLVSVCILGHCRQQLEPQSATVSFFYTRSGSYTASTTFKAQTRCFLFFLTRTYRRQSECFWL